MVKQKDPVNDAAKAMLVKRSNLFKGILTFCKYSLAAKKVPVKEGIFSEPITLATDSFGNKINPAGVCINPPPPTIASTNPATNAIMHNNMSVLSIHFF